MRNIRFNILKDLFPKFPTIFLYLFIINKLNKFESILDLGCGPNSLLRFVKANTYGVDISFDSIQIAKKNNTHNKLKVMDIKKIASVFKDKSFDVVLAMDVIEHMSKRDGLILIKNMEKIARKKVVIFTPNGHLMQKGEKYDRHLSGWNGIEMNDYGYKVYGMFGPRQLRGREHKLKYFPQFFWAIVSELIQWLYIVVNNKHATALLCIKEFKYD